MAARTVSREESHANVAPAVSHRSIGNRLLAAGLGSSVPVARLPLYSDTAKHDYSGVVKYSTREWNVTPLSSVMRVGSLCNASDGVHVYGVDLVNVISGVNSPTTHRPHLRLLGVGEGNLS